MSTAYTSNLPDTFAEFALRCARAFGYLIELRDEDVTAPLPKTFTADNYHLEEVKKAQAALAKVTAWTEDEADHAVKRQHASKVREYERIQRERGALAIKYKVMLAHVNKWRPPTPEHSELRTFMQEQLTSSLEHDCDPEFIAALKPSPMRPTGAGAAYRAREIRQLNADIAYHQEQYAKDVARAKQQTAWVTALRRSL